MIYECKMYKYHLIKSRPGILETKQVVHYYSVQCPTLDMLP